MTKYTIRELDKLIATNNAPSPGPKQVAAETVVDLATQLRELLLPINSKAFIDFLFESFDPRFTLNWGPWYTYGDDADGNRGTQVRDLESIEVDGLPDWAPKSWLEVLIEWRRRKERGT